MTLKPTSRHRSSTQREASATHLICSARVPRMRARSYLVMYRVVVRGPSLGLGGPVCTC